MEAAVRGADSLDVRDPQRPGGAGGPSSAGEAGNAPGELDGLPEIYRELEAVVGLEAALSLARYLGGTQQYFPRFERIELVWRNRRIRAEFNGRNLRELARRYKISCRHVREVLRWERTGWSSGHRQG
jgi:hypothetical protein